MSDKLPASVMRVQQAITDMGYDIRVNFLEVAARTAAEAADAVGCKVEQIVKSLVLKAGESKKPVLVLVGGANRLDEKLIGGYVGEPVKMARADFVRKNSGYAIGGVPPVAHEVAMVTYIDEDLMGFEEIWAAGGHPNALFQLKPDDLVKMTGGRVVPVK